MAIKVVITGAGGNAGQAVSQLVADAGFDVRMADMVPPAPHILARGELVRCDTRTPTDVQRAVAGADAVIHLAAWHSAHQPPVSDATIFAVNVDGTFNVLEACRGEGVGAMVFASSMAYGWGSIYGVTKVLGEELCRAYHEITGAAIAMLRYHEFVPAPYLTFGPRLLRNGVDRADVATATLAALRATVDRRVELFRTIVHTDHGMPPAVIADFRHLGPDWRDPPHREIRARAAGPRRAARPLGGRPRPWLDTGDRLCGVPAGPQGAGCQGRGRGCLARPGRAGRGDVGVIDATVAFTQALIAKPAGAGHGTFKQDGTSTGGL